MDSSTTAIKARLQAFFAARPDTTIARLAEVAGVSQRTMRRYLDPEHSSVADIVMLCKIATAFDISLDLLFFPEELPSTPISRSQLNAFRSSVQKSLALLWTDENMNVIYCSDAFAALYDSTPKEMIGTNMFGDWSSYAHDRYSWLSRPVPDTRKSQIETLVSVSQHEGAGSLQTYFLAPDGTLTEVLIKCFYMDPGFLFLDVAKDDPFLAEDRKAAVDENGVPVLRLKNMDVYFDDISVLSGFMSGWDRQKIAEHVGITRSEVTHTLGRIMKWLQVDDLDALRESAWERVFEPRMVDKYNIVRCNGKVLR